MFIAGGLVKGLVAGELWDTTNGTAAETQACCCRGWWLACTAQPPRFWAEDVADGAWQNTDCVILRLCTGGAYWCFFSVLIPTYNVLILKHSFKDKVVEEGV